MATETVVKKETKNKISVDFEGKLTFKLKRNYLRYIAGYCAFTRSIIIYAIFPCENLTAVNRGKKKLRLFEAKFYFSALIDICNKFIKYHKPFLKYSQQGLFSFSLYL